MARNIKLLVYPVRDLTAAKALYNRVLGVEPYADAPYYVGYRVDGQEIGLDPNGRSQGSIGYVEVEDIRAELQRLLDAGAQMRQQVRDIGGARLIATVKDADGNIIGLMQDI
jgi:predicted enzyme related to lactoylglutathione lyase